MSENSMFRLEDIPRFELKDLVGRKLYIDAYQESNCNIVFAMDLKCNELFVISEIHAPAPSPQTAEVSTEQPSGKGEQLVPEDYKVRRLARAAVALRNKAAEAGIGMLERVEIRYALEALEIDLDDIQAELAAGPIKEGL